MPITFSSAIANYLDRRYDVIRNLEEPGGTPSLKAYHDSTKGVSIN